MEGDHRLQPRDLQIWHLTLLRFTLQMNAQLSVAQRHFHHAQDPLI